VVTGQFVDNAGRSMTRLAPHYCGATGQTGARLLQRDALGQIGVAPQDADSECSPSGVDVEIGNAS
jgi:hypothetical protein